MQSATPCHTLHGIKETAESRKDTATDGDQEISPLLCFLGRRGVLGGDERRVRNMIRIPYPGIHGSHFRSLETKPGLKF